MSARWKALRALRMNYTRRGVIRWLRSPNVYGRAPGWWIWWHAPEWVTQMQHALAEGAYL